MPDRAGRSIGEVLEELRDDFPDVSVSKIRFLESQGLISPQRTASGYRLFSDDDVALLRWILLQQREHYLPLKVIRKRLREGDGPRTADRNGRAEAAPAPADDHGRPAPVPPDEAESVRLEAAEEASWLILPDAALSGSGGAPGQPGPEATAPAPAGPAEPAEDAASGGATSVAEEAALPGPPASPAAEAAGTADDLWAEAAAGRTLTRAELLREAGLDEKALAELESYGLVSSRQGAFDGDALSVARLAAGFFRFGVEARHLRMYKSFAEREAAFLEQVVMPMVNPRQEESQVRAREALADLARLGQALRLSMLRVALAPAAGDQRAR